MEQEYGVKTMIAQRSGIWKSLYAKYHLAMVLQGNIRLRFGEQNFYLSEKDVIIFVPGDQAEYFGGRESLLIETEMDAAFLESRIPVHEGHFICNSSVDQQHDYAPLQRLMVKMALALTKGNDMSQTYYESLAYMLVYHLGSNYFEKTIVNIENVSEKYADRINEILLYIRQNYGKGITLSAMARHMRWSSSYLSRFFKNVFKENFVDYLKRYRLERSVHQLLYTKESVSYIAMDCGFPNASAYIQDFRAYYGETPGTYRKKYSIQKEFSRPMGKEDLSENAVSFLEKMTKDLETDTELIMDGRQECHYMADVDSEEKLVVPVWKTGISVAAASYMPFADIADEIKEAQKDIGFIYGRISFLMTNTFIYNPENDSYNFYYFTRMIQALRKDGMIPYLDINYACTNVPVKGKNYIIDAGEFLRCLEALLLYSANVFGIGEMEKWIYDIGIVFHFTTHNCEDPDAFAERFAGAYRLIKRIVPGARVGGFDVSAVFMADHCELILNRLAQKKIVPDFISVNIFPYVSLENNGYINYAYASGDGFLKKYVENFKGMIRRCCQPGDKIPEFFVSAVGTTLMHRHYLNDTCYQSAFVAKMVIDLVEDVDLLCYYQLSDMNFSGAEDQRLLGGRNGLVAQFGIHKPGYLIFMLMSAMSNRLIARGADYMITKGDHDTYNILLCNPVKISGEWCLKINENTSLSNAYTIYEPGESKSIFITLNHVNDGDYRIISYHVNRENGSLFDEWEKTGFWENPGIHELDYLRQAIHPKRNCSMRSSVNGQLNFHIHVQPFEVVMIEVVRMV